jgi:preprotein translocase subunit SecE
MLSPGKYLSEVTEEVKKVTWPSRQQTIDMTILVVGVSLLIGVYIGTLDFLFQELLAKVLLGT